MPIDNLKNVYTHNTNSAWLKRKFPQNMCNSDISRAFVPQSNRKEVLGWICIDVGTKFVTRKKKTSIESIATILSNRSYATFLGNFSQNTLNIYFFEASQIDIITFNTPSLAPSRVLPERFRLSFTSLMINFIQQFLVELRLNM